jgi:hypothetical protein
MVVAQVVDSCFEVLVPSIAEVRCKIAEWAPVRSTVGLERYRTELGMFELGSYRFVQGRYMIGQGRYNFEQVRCMTGVGVLGRYMIGVLGRCMTAGLVLGQVRCNQTVSVQVRCNQIVPVQVRYNQIVPVQVRYNLLEIHHQIRHQMPHHLRIHQLHRC